MIYDKVVDLIGSLLAEVEPNTVDREGLADTPERVAQAFKYWFSGYHQNVESLFKTFEDGAQDYDEMILQGGIPFYSHCEHHMAPFFGFVHIGYIPCGKIIGLSKMLRLVDAYAHRLTVQERLTTQLADSIVDNLMPLGAGVVVQARHLCIESRGVCKPGSITTTSALRGCLKDNAAARSEFLQFARSSTAQYKP